MCWLENVISNGKLEWWWEKRAETFLFLGEFQEITVFKIIPFKIQLKIWRSVSDQNLKDEWPCAEQHSLVGDVSAYGRRLELGDP